MRLRHSSYFVSFFVTLILVGFRQPQGFESPGRPSTEVPPTLSPERAQPFGGEFAVENEEESDDEGKEEVEEEDVSVEGTKIHKKTQRVLRTLANSLQAKVREQWRKRSCPTCELMPVLTTCCRRKLFTKSSAAMCRAVLLHPASMRSWCWPQLAL